MPENESAQPQALGKIIARAWSDPGFAARLKSDPKAALAEAGMDVPEDVRVTTYFAEKDEVVLVIPAPP
ncbi:MAG: NHLP leader peptide family natural product precursor, partial [Alphaproteobacteria bacterium]